ncbi:hypothetical protein JK231_23115 [Pantoea sp. JGM49]|uniref:DUF4209 domain-containing protein n=1 Tax=Pantoea sp. JGM49 TaxID=2799791 RepID=UPI001BA49EC0|nr:hypothetical protein [Pantoea sp. JGM49]
MSKIPKQEGSDNQYSLEFVTADDFRQADINTILHDYSGLCDSNMWLELNRIAHASSEKNNSSAHRAHRILVTLCSFRMSADDPAGTWHPRWQDENNTMLTPSMLGKEQISVLADILSEIKNTALRGRIADVIWSSDRSQFKAGTEAIKSYCEIIGFHLYKTDVKGNISYPYIFELVNLLQKSLYIHFSMGEKKLINDPLRETFEKVYDFLVSNTLYVPFQRIGELAYRYKIKTYMEVAHDSEKVLSEGQPDDYPDARKKVWSLAAKCYEKVNDSEGQRRCLEEYTIETLRMRELVSDAAAKAAWTRQAITELQVAGGFKEWVEKLISELRDLQQLSVSELTPINTPWDLTKEFKETETKFQKLNIPQSLFIFAQLSASPTVHDLEEFAMANSSSGLTSLFPGKLHVDHEGRPVARTSSEIKGDEPDAQWLKENSLETMSEHRHKVVVAGIEPARKTIMLGFPLEVRHFDALVNYSHFVPFGHEHLFSLGFSRLFQGDFASAAYILIPQLENTLRHVLFCNGKDSSKFNDGEFQEDRTLSGLLENRKSDLVSVLGENIVNEIDLLFNYKAGPSLRHKVAHGKLAAGNCYDTDTVYACWFIFRLICLPILNDWEEKIAPQIQMTL